MAGGDLPAETMEAAMSAIMEGSVDPAQLAGFLCALRTKGETPEEIAAAARVLRARSIRLDVPRDRPLLDTCGTGGDGLDTPNVSTMVALVAAAAGIRVAKHGNRSVSSRCGSADLVEALGIPLEPGPAAAIRALTEAGITFLFAPAYHPAMKHAAPVRRSLKVRTLFNLLGPLANPVTPEYQVLGLYDGSLTEVVARTLALLGTRRALVLHGEDGMDELTTRAATRGHRLEDGRVTPFSVTPQELSVTPPDPEALGGGDATANRMILLSVLGGHGPEPVADLVAVNAGAALWIAGVESNLWNGVGAARSILRTGAALKVLERWRAILAPA